MFRKMLLLSLGLLMIISCGVKAIGPNFPHSVVVKDLEYSPVLDEWRIWWKEVEVCLNKELDIDSVLWFTGSRLIDDGVNLKGFHTIGQIVLNRELIKDKRLIKHESIHAILYANVGDGDSKHETKYWECLT